MTYPRFAIIFTALYICLGLFFPFQPEFAFVFMLLFAFPCSAILRKTYPVLTIVPLDSPRWMHVSEHILALYLVGMLQWTFLWMGMKLWRRIRSG